MSLLEKYLFIKTLKRKRGFFILFLFVAPLVLYSQNKYIDSLQKVFEKTRADSSKIKVLNEFIDYYTEKDVNKALNYALQAIEIARHNGSKELMAKAYLYKAHVLVQNVDYNHALDLYHIALNLNLETKNINVRSFIYGSLGRLHRYMGYNDSALFYYQLGLRLREKSGDSVGVYRLCNNIGLIFRNQGVLDHALQYFLRSLNGFEREGSTTMMASPLQNIGNIFYSKGDYDKALEYYKKALELKENTDDASGIADLNINIASTYMKNGHDNEALEIFTKAEQIYRELGNIGRAAHCYDNMGDVYLKLKDYDKAAAYIKKGLELRRQAGNQIDLSYSLNNLANYYVLTREPAKALDLLKEAINIGNKANALPILERSYYIQIQAFKINNQYQKALDAYEKYLVIHDSITGLSNSQQLIQQSLQYEFDKKQEQFKTQQRQKEISLEHQVKAQKMLIYPGIGIIVLLIVIIFLIFRMLRLRKRTLQIMKDHAVTMEQQNEELKQQQLEITRQHHDLEKLIATRDKFFNIIAHDLKNPFNTIHGLTELMMRNFESNSPEHQRELIGMLYKSSKNAYNLVENLLNWASTQTGIIKVIPEKFDLIGLIKLNIQLHTEHAGIKQLKMEYFGLPEAFVFADKKMIDTVIRNLISNALKYSQPGGIVRISAIPENLIVWVNVEDSGTGMTEEQINNLFKIEKLNSTEGTANEMGTGLGLIISNEFVTLNMGEIKIQSQPEKGSKFSFSVPLYKEDTDIDR